MPIRKWFTALGAAITAVFAASLLSAPAAKAQLKCSFGGYGSHLMGPEIVGLGTTGQTVGAVADCDLPLAGTKAFVGAGVSYGFIFGDTKDVLGIEHELTLRGRLGYNVTSNIAPYVFGGWARADGGGDSWDGIKFGGGIEFALDGPFIAFVEYEHGIWDVSGAPVDVTSDAVKVGLKIRLGGQEAKASLK